MFSFRAFFLVVCLVMLLEASILFQPARRLIRSLAARVEPRNDIARRLVYGDGMIRAVLIGQVAVMLWLTWLLEKS